MLSLIIIPIRRSFLAKSDRRTPSCFHHEGCRSCACETGVEEGSCFLKGTSPKGKEGLRKTTVPAPGVMAAKGRIRRLGTSRGGSDRGRAGRDGAGKGGRRGRGKAGRVRKAGRSRRSPGRRSHASRGSGHARRPGCPPAPPAG